MDETTVTLHPTLHRCWVKRGQRKLVPAPGTPLRTHIFGAYNWRDDTVAWRCFRHKNTDSFIAFLEHVLFTVYPNQKILLVLDNASYHTSGAAQAALSLFSDRLQVLWLPAYCPFLNPIERFWLHLKDLVCANFLHASLEALEHALESALHRQNDLLNLERFSYRKHFQLSA